MATFPTLVPAARSYTLGEYPVTTETGFGGGNIRFLHGTGRSSIELDLTFNALTQANAKLIRDHYRNQNGSHISFPLPPSIWTGHSAAGNIISTQTYWRYAQPPSEEHLEIGRITVAVQLLSLLPL